jgi:hypothetical protein
MSFKVVNGILASDVANGATFTTGYPNNANIGTFTGGVAHQLQVGQNTLLLSPVGVSLAFGASSITVTNRSGGTLPAGAPYALQLETLGDDDIGDPASGFPLRTARGPIRIFSLGSPLTADADGIFASAAIAAATPVLAGSFTGALAVSGAVVLDVPRALVGAWTNTAVLTVTGTDEYGNVLAESSASGTSFTGKKAFKTITKIATSADITGATVGTGDVLGLPAFLGATGFVLKELQDGAAATAGTVVAGIQTAGGSTATTGDVRGTYDPNAACDGSKSFQLIVAMADTAYRGIPQFAG